MAFVHLNTEVRNSKPGTGRGLFATGPIRRGEIVTDTMGAARAYTKEEAAALSPEQQGYLYGGRNGELLGPIDFSDLHPVWRVNHSCTPNLGSAPNFDQLIAMRDIAPGEHLTFDYAMTDAGDEEMVCACGSSRCRGLILGTDWMKKDLQIRYAGWFQPNVQRLIDATRESASSP